MHIAWNYQRIKEKTAEIGILNSPIPLPKENMYHQLQNHASSYQLQKAECGQDPAPCPPVSALPGWWGWCLGQENLFGSERNPAFQLCKDTHTLWDKDRHHHNSVHFFFPVIGFANQNWLRVNWSGCQFCVLKDLEKAPGLEGRCPGLGTQRGRVHCGHGYSLDIP